MRLELIKGVQLNLNGEILIGLCQWLYENGPSL